MTISKGLLRDIVMNFKSPFILGNFQAKRMSNNFNALLWILGIKNRGTVNERFKRLKPIEFPAIHVDPRLAVSLGNGAVRFTHPFIIFFQKA